MSIKTAMAGAALAAMTLVAGGASAAVYDFTFVDQISFASTPGISAGDTFTVHLFADNGGNTTVSQTWDNADLLGFTINAGSYSATYSKAWEFPSTGNFVTDAGGNVISVQLFGTSGASNNTDNFGSWTGDTVYGDASFYDFHSRYNSIVAGTFTHADQWTVGPAGSSAPEPAAWAMMLVGFAGLGAALRARKAAVLTA